MGFFDKLKEQATTLGAQLDQALDATKTKTQIASMRRKRLEMVANLGEALLEQFRIGKFNVAALQQHAESVFELEKRILELESQVEPQGPVPGARNMPHQPAGQRMSSEMGHEFSAAEQSSEEVCAACGSQVPKVSVFCPQCGHRLRG